MRKYSKNPPPTLLPDEDRSDAASKGGQAWCLGLVSIMSILSLAACKSSSFLDKTSSKLKLHEELLSKTVASNQAKSTVQLTRTLQDSSGFEYQVNIFPLDTFRFSPDGGFVGLASRVDISGRLTRQISVRDSVYGVSEAENKIRQETAATMDLLQKEDVKTRETVRRGNGYLLLIVIGLLIVGVFVYLSWKRAGLISK